LDLPHFDLDHIAYPNKIERSHEERVLEVKKLAEKTAWITEGIYVHFTEALFKEADQIIWLDLPYLTTLFRVIKRYFVHLIRGDETHGFFNTLKFIWNLRLYFYPKKGQEHGSPDKQTTRHKTEHALKPHMEKVITIQNDQQLKNLLDQI
jgi:adenylate kinase family enzyme